MAKKKPEEQSDIDRLQEWISAVGGHITLGSSALQSIETSKSGSKVTIVLKKNKASKDLADPAIDDD